MNLILQEGAPNALGSLAGIDIASVGVNLEAMNTINTINADEVITAIETEPLAEPVAKQMTASFGQNQTSNELVERIDEFEGATFQSLGQAEFEQTGRLSKHFTVKEASHSSTALRLGLPNHPGRPELLAASLLAENILEPLRHHFGVPFSPMSWIRTEPLERHLCSKAFSRWCRARKVRETEDSWQEYFKRKSHPRGEAVDIELPGVANDDLYDWIAANLRYDQLIREFRNPGQPKSGWVHVSFSAVKNRMECFSINR